MTDAPHIVEKAISPATKLLYTKIEAAAMLSISLRTVDTLISLNELRVCRIRRRVLISHTALLNFIRQDHRAEFVAA